MNFFCSLVATIAAAVSWFFVLFPSFQASTVLLFFRDFFDRPFFTIGLIRVFGFSLYLHRFLEGCAAFRTFKRTQCPPFCPFPLRSTVPIFFYGAGRSHIVVPVTACRFFRGVFFFASSVFAGVPSSPPPFLGRPERRFEPSVRLLSEPPLV